MWQAIIGSPVSPEQVVLCMTALKLAREAGGHEPDNINDAIGYMSLMNEVSGRGMAAAYPAEGVAPSEAEAYMAAQATVAGRSVQYGPEDAKSDPRVRRAY